MRVLFSVSELHPYIKTGGLADVAGALPRALSELDVDVRLLMPAYPELLRQCRDLGLVAQLDGFAQLPAARLLMGRASALDLPIYLLDCPALYARAGGLYSDSYGADWTDNHLRFGLLGHAAALLAGSDTPLAWAPDILHCNDWQAGLAPAYLHYRANARAATLMTIHNLAYQGIFPQAVLPALGLPPRAYAIDGVEYYGNVSFLKAGLHFADRISTVSPNYAREIQTEALGFGLHGLLATRADDLTGVLNGIDTRAWDPERDAHLVRNYDVHSIEAKRTNTDHLRRRLGLAARPATLLLGIVSRLTHQKGLDVVLAALPEVLALPAQICVLGSGEPALEQAWRAAAQQYAGEVAVQIGFDEALSHQIEAGADAFLMPSRFEPCGLNQMYSQRYGTLPLVHATGGLVDSVVDTSAATLAAGTASGFAFAPLDAAALIACLQRAQALWQRPEDWQSIQRNAMQRDFDWKASAKQYYDLYKSMNKEK